MKGLLQKVITALFCVAIIVSCSLLKNGGQKNKTNISPYDFGLSQARTGIERYGVLLKTHKAAVAAGVDVDYSGIKNIDIEIPEKFTTIPLTTNNDFKREFYQNR